MEKSFFKSHGNVRSTHLLESIYRLLGGEERLLRVLFDFEKSQWPFQDDNIKKVILEMNSDDQILIRLAMDFWNQSGSVKLIEALELLDDLNCKRLIVAICHQKQIRKEVIHALVDDEDGSICHL